MRETTALDHADKKMKKILVIFQVRHGLPDGSAERGVLLQRMCKAHQRGAGSKTGELVLMGQTRAR